MAIDRTKLNDLLYTLSENDTVALPSGGTAQVREMTGHEQRNFMNRAKLTNGTAFQELLAACVISIGDETLPLETKARQDHFLEMLSADRRALLFGIRRHSLGDNFQFSTKCPSCGDQKTWEVDLSDKAAFPVTPCPHGDAKEFHYESKVHAGLVFKLQLLDGKAEMAVLRKRNEVDLLTDLEMRRPHVESEHEGRTVWIPVVLNRLPDKLLAEMRREVKSAEGDIRTAVKVVCSSCANTVEFDLLQIPDFMTPSVTS